MNEQSVVGMLLAGPGVLATLTFAPVAITVFYCRPFPGCGGCPALDLPRHRASGHDLASGIHHHGQGEAAVFFFSELSWALVAATLTWFLVRNFGLTGAGIGFFASYVFHLIITYPIARHLSRFHWSPASTRTGLIFAAMIAAVFCLFQFVSFAVAMVDGNIDYDHCQRVLGSLAPPAHAAAELTRAVSPAGSLISTSLFHLICTGNTVQITGICRL